MKITKKDITKEDIRELNEAVVLKNELKPTEKEMESLCNIAEFMTVELYAIGTELDNELLRDLQSVIDKLKAVK